MKPFSYLTKTADEYAKSWEKAVDDAWLNAYEDCVASFIWAEQHRVRTFGIFDTLTPEAHAVWLENK